MQFSHEKLDVYRLSIAFVTWITHAIHDLHGDLRFARKQLIRSSQSIPQNIAEGNGKRSRDDRRRYFDTARGSAMECAATLDILAAAGTWSEDKSRAGKELLVRIVGMLTRLAPPDNVA
jgi:four helix bundle protein